MAKQTAVAGFMMMAIFKTAAITLKMQLLGAYIPVYI